VKCSIIDVAIRFLSKPRTQRSGVSGSRATAYSAALRARLGRNAHCLRAHTGGFLESALPRLTFRGGHGLDAPRQARTVSWYPAREARPSIRKRIDMKTKNAQFLHAGIERGSLGGILYGPNGHTQLVRRWQSQ